MPLSGNATLLALNSSLAEYPLYNSMIKVYILFSITTDFAIAAKATIDDGIVCGEFDFMPLITGNVNVTLNITDLDGTWSY